MISRSTPKCHNLFRSYAAKKSSIVAAKSIASLPILLGTVTGVGAITVKCESFEEKNQNQIPDLTTGTSSSSTCQYYKGQHHHHHHHHHVHSQNHTKTKPESDCVTVNSGTDSVAAQTESEQNSDTGTCSLADQEKNQRNSSNLSSRYSQSESWSGSEFEISDSQNEDYDSMNCHDKKQQYSRQRSSVKAAAKTKTTSFKHSTHANNITCCEEPLDSGPHSAQRQTLAPEGSALSNRANSIKGVEKLPWWRQLARFLARIFRMGKRAFAIFVSFSPILAFSVPCFLLHRYSSKYHHQARDWWFNALLTSLQHAGPTFVKLAQWAATRRDLFPAILCHKLCLLHSHVDPHHIRDTEKILQEEFGANWSKQIVIEDEQPVGSGCIAQVYRGKYYRNANSTSDSDPLNVAIKVMHPGVRELVEADLEILTVIAETLESWLPCTMFLNLSTAVHQSSTVLTAQCDFRIEADYTIQFARNFGQNQDNHDVIISSGPDKSEPLWSNPAYDIRRREESDKSDSKTLQSQSQYTTVTTKDHSDQKLQQNNNQSKSNSKFDSVTVKFPRIYHASPNILVESFEPGLPMHDLLHTDAEGLDDFTPKFRRKASTSRWLDLFGGDTEIEQEEQVEFLPVKSQNTQSASASGNSNINKQSFKFDVLNKPSQDLDEATTQTRTRVHNTINQALYGAVLRAQDKSDSDSEFKSSSYNSKNSDIISDKLPSDSRSESSNNDTISEDELHDSTRVRPMKSLIRRKSEFSEKFLKQISELAMHSYLKMLFEDHFVHGDLHPGNMYWNVRENGSPELIFLDCGLAIKLNDRDAKNFQDCVYAILHGQPSDAARLMIERSPGDKTRIQDSSGFQRKVGRLIEDFRRSRENGMRVAEVTATLLVYAGQHNVTLETNFVNVAISLAVMDGLGRQLHDEFNIFRAATPYLAKAALRYKMGQFFS